MSKTLWQSVAKLISLRISFGLFVIARTSWRMFMKGMYPSLCHLANVSYRLGEKSSFNKKSKADNKRAYEIF